MATAFTSLLGLALPVTGELAGTWGDTVNNSITSLLDSAISGTTTLSADADVTLTTTTGTANQARQAILLCSGARTVVRNITAPAQSKLYVVINNTTGGFSVVIRGVGPTAGVTVANGKTAVVVWNGSDFVEVAPAVATNLSGGVAGSLPYQTAGSATTFLGIGAANYVLTSTGTAPTWTLNTGTGSVVRATSPTLVTPTFTTSATFPLHIGGTATTSTLILRSTSGVGTTGSDIIFQVGNNGATEAMRVLNSGFVGIGTNAPTTKLDVNGTVRAYGGAYSSNQSVTAFSASIASNWTNRLIAGSDAGGSPFFAIQVASDASNGSTERMRIDSVGRVGVGVTPSLWAEKVIDLGSYGAVYGGGANFGASSNLYYNGTNWIYKNTAAGSLFNLSSGGMSVFTSPSGTAGANATLTQALTLTEAGLFGIGTASPSEFVDISKTQDAVTRAIIRNVSGGVAAQAQYQLSNGTSLVSFGHTGTAFTTAGVFRQNGSYISAAGAGGLTLNTSVAQPIYFGTNSTERMRIDSAGNVGIGTTAPSFKLHVTGDVNGDSSIASANSNAGSVARGIVQFGSQIAAGILSANSSAFVATPGQGRPDGIALFTGSTSTGGIDIGARSASGIITFGTGGGTERMRIDSAGNVGIGTTTPVNALQVNGSFGRNAPVTKTTSFTLAATENWLICNGTATITVTLPAASSWTGREVMIKNIAAFTVVSASSNVVPLSGGAAGTAILPATAGAWATLVSDGTNWIIMQS